MIRERQPLSMIEADSVLGGLEETNKITDARSFIKKFSKLDAKKAKELREELEKLGLLKMKPIDIAKLIDILPEDSDAKYLIDIDLMIFGQSKEEFLQYEDAIQKEFEHIETKTYKQGRSELLQKFLQRDFIYSTKYFRDKLEKNARTNLKFSIERLKG